MGEELWPGGYVRADKRGRKVYWIRRMLEGTRYHLSTRCTNLRSAMAELVRFEADPVGYRPGGGLAGEPVVLDSKMVERFVEWSRTDEGNSKVWVQQQRMYLLWWRKALNGVDLRRCSLERDILPALDGAKSRGHRIAVLKRVFSWLVAVERKLRPAEDPTFRALKVPQAKPEQWKRSKAIPFAHYTAARAGLVGHWRDALDVLAGTGWHTTELCRFARAGAVEAYHGRQEGVTAILACPEAKSGAPHRTAVGEDVEGAGRRLLDRGSVSVPKLNAAIAQACAAAEPRPVPAFTAGRFRHSVATWAIEKGADPAAVATFLGHKSPRTTKRFYATLAVPPKVPTLR
jgi:hypothetical protein